MATWHISPRTNKLERCSATKRGCPYGGQHYSSKEQGENALRLKQEIFSDATELLQNKKKRINEFDLRDQHQPFTVYNQLLKEGFTEEDITGLLSEDLGNRMAGLGIVKAPEGDSPILGVIYTGDYRYEEENGLAKISEALSKGTLDPKTIELQEYKGATVLVIPKPPTNRYEGDLGEAEKSATVAVAYKRFKEIDIPSHLLYGNRKTMAEMRAELKGNVKPLPTNRKDLELAYLKFKHPEEFSAPPKSVGEFHTGRALVIVADNPIMASTMRKVKAASDTGNLRVGGSSNPFSRGVVFYDQRDISGNHQKQILAQQQAEKLSYERVESVKKKLDARNNSIASYDQGNLYALQSNASPSTPPGQEKYFLNYGLPRNKRTADGGTQIFGWFTKEQLEKIADGDYSPYEEQERERERRNA